MNSLSWVTEGAFHLSAGERSIVDTRAKNWDSILNTVSRSVVFKLLFIISISIAIGEADVLRLPCYADEGFWKEWPKANEHQKALWSITGADMKWI